MLGEKKRSGALVLRGNLPWNLRQNKNSFSLEKFFMAVTELGRELQCEAVSRSQSSVSHRHSDGEEKSSLPGGGCRCYTPGPT